MVQPCRLLWAKSERRIDPTERGSQTMDLRDAKVLRNGLLATPTDLSSNAVRDVGAALNTLSSAFITTRMSIGPFRCPNIIRMLMQPYIFGNCVFPSADQSLNRTT